jgi:hypothetical protein
MSPVFTLALASAFSLRGSDLHNAAPRTRLSPGGENCDSLPANPAQRFYRTAQLP